MLQAEIRHRRGAFTLEVALALPPGVTALFGPSGAGKSTVVAALAGLLRPEEGLVRLGDRILLDTRRRVWVPAHRRRIAVVFQESRLFPHLSVRGNLTFARWFRRQDQPRLDDVVALLGLGALLDRPPRTLSGGERQRVAIGRALLAGPDALLLDEPLASLDAARKAEILPYLERLVADTAIPVLYITHALEEVLRLAPRTVLLAEGRVVAAGATAEVVAQAGLASAADRLEPASLLGGVIEAYDPAARLSAVLVGPHRLLLPGRLGAIGAALELRVPARDVAVALQRPDSISIRNILPGVIRSVRGAREGAEAELAIDIGGAVLQARLTRAAIAELRLGPGKPVYALVKAVAVDRVLG